MTTTRITRQLYDNVKITFANGSSALKTASKYTIPISTVYEIAGTESYDDFVDKIRGNIQDETVMLGTRPQDTPFEPTPKKGYSFDPQTVTPVVEIEKKGDGRGVRTYPPTFTLNASQTVMACEAFSAGHTFKYVADALGISLHYFRMAINNDPETAAKIKKAREEGKEVLQRNKVALASATKRRNRAERMGLGIEETPQQKPTTVNKVHKEIKPVQEHPKENKKIQRVVKPTSPNMRVIGATSRPVTPKAKKEIDLKDLAYLIISISGSILLLAFAYKVLFG